MTPSRTALPLLLASFLALAGCATRPVNPPVEKYVPTTLGSTVERPGQSDVNRQNLVILAFSGGGTRAAAFAYGVLETLRRTEAVSATGRRVRLLDEVDVITGISGGSFTALAYGLYGEKLFDEYEQRFLKRDVQGALVGRFFNPLNWEPSRRPATGARRWPPTFTTRSCSTGDLRRPRAQGRPADAVGATDLPPARASCSPNPTSTCCAPTPPVPARAAAPPRPPCRSSSRRSPSTTTVGHAASGAALGGAVHRPAGPAATGRPHDQAPARTARICRKQGRAVPASRRRRGLRQPGTPERAGRRRHLRGAARGRPADAARSRAQSDRVRRQLAVVPRDGLGQVGGCAGLHTSTPQGIRRSDRPLLERLGRAAAGHLGALASDAAAARVGDLRQGIERGGRDGQERA